MIVELYVKNKFLDLEFIDNIIGLSKKYHFNKIKTSGNILVHLSDFLLTDIVETVQDSEFKGYIMYKDKFCISVYKGDLDWDDNKIIPIYDKTIIRKYKINKINKINNDILEEIICENLLEF